MSPGGIGRRLVEHRWAGPDVGAIDSRVGGGLVETDIGARRPKYAEYMRRTPTFFPGRPKLK